MSAQEAEDATLLGGDIVFTQLPHAPGPGDPAAEGERPVSSRKGNEIRVLALVDGRRTVADILRLSPLPNAATLNHLRALRERGVLGRQDASTVAASTADAAPPPEGAAPEPEPEAALPVAAPAAVASRPNVVVIDTRHRDRPGAAARAASSFEPAGAAVAPNSWSTAPSPPADGASAAPAARPAPSGGPAPFRLGEYEVATRIGQGGMGSVYVCRKAGAGGFQRLFTLKVVRQHADQQDLAVRSLLREAKVGAWLDHPNIQAVVDVGHYKDQPFLILDYIEGVSLGDLLSGERRPPPGVVVAIVLDVLRGLERTHTLRDERGVPHQLVHGDISPANVLVGADGVSRLTDFGSCRVLSEEGANPPDPLKLGKPCYMAPEQLCAEPVDARTDLFALGAMMFAALTGQELFAADSYDQIVLNVLRKRIPPLGELGAPACLDDICRRALSRAREGRFPSADAMAQVLLKTAAANDLLASSTEVGQHVRREFGELLDEQRRRIQNAFEGAAPNRVRAWDTGAVRTLNATDVGRAVVDAPPQAANRGAEKKPMPTLFLGTAPASADDQAWSNRGAEKKPFPTLLLPSSAPALDEPEPAWPNRGAEKKPFPTMILPSAAPAAVADAPFVPQTAPEVERTDRLATSKTLWQWVAQERRVIYASVAVGVVLMTVTVLLARPRPPAPAPKARSAMVAPAGAPATMPASPTP